MRLEVVYVGQKFYVESGTTMSPMYLRVANTEEGLQRFDWSDVENAIKNNHEVLISPATDKELVWAYKRLDTLTKGR